MTEIAVPPQTAAPEMVSEPTARMLLGAPIAEQIREDVRRDLAAFATRHGWMPAIAVVLVGDDAPSRVYAGRILRNCETVGTTGRLVELPGDTTLAGLRACLAELNADPAVGGIIVQMPLPGHIPHRAAIECIHPLKDIDGIHPLTAGLLSMGYEAFAPSCPEAAVEILRRSGVALAGRRVAVIGRSSVVGRPAQLLLTRANATVTVCHSRTADLAAEVRRAEVVVVGAGAPALVTGDMLQPGAIVIDCGINVVDGAIIGDVHLPSVSTVAGAVTPVPGGVGPVTNAVLLRHLVRAAQAQVDGGFPDAVQAGAVTAPIGIR